VAGYGYRGGGGVGEGVRYLEGLGKWAGYGCVQKCRDKTMYRCVQNWVFDGLRVGGGGGG
jgi:hypothetical protein